MGYTIVSGDKPSAVALHQNHAVVFIEMLYQMTKFYSKSQKANNQVGWCYYNKIFRTKLEDY